MLLKQKALESDSELPTKEENDNFWIRRIVKFTVLGIFVIAAVFMTGMFLTKLVIDDVFQSRVFDIIIPQLGVIVVAGMAILGMKKLL